MQNKKIFATKMCKEDSLWYTDVMASSSSRTTINEKNISKTINSILDSLSVCIDIPTTLIQQYNIVPNQLLLPPPLVSGPTPHKTQVSELNSDIMGEYQRTLWPLSSPHTTSTSLLSLLQIHCKFAANEGPHSSNSSFFEQKINAVVQQWTVVCYFFSFFFFNAKFSKMEKRVADAPHGVIDIT